MNQGTVCPQFIFASSKPWNRVHFEKLQQNSGQDWVWVSNRDELRAALGHSNPRYIFFVHWNWLVPEDIWSRYECVCFHMTDVPYGRGGSPLQNLIVAGHKTTKLTALRMMGDMDAGPVYAKRDMSLDGRAEEIYLRVGEISFDLIQWMIETEPAPTPQHGEVLNFKRRTPDQSMLPNVGDLNLIYDHIRMLDAPTYPHAFCEHGNFHLEFTDAELQGDQIVAKVVIRKTPNT